jgi:phage shock protein C
MTDTHNHNDRKGGLYRSRNGLFFGVAKGLANQANLPVWVVRFSFIIAAILTQVLPVVVLYLVLAIVIRPEPMLNFSSVEEKEFYNTYGSTRKPAIDRMRSILERLEKRVQRLENAVTDSEKDWERRFYTSR